MDRFECDGLHDEKWLRSCEEFELTPYAISCCTNCRKLYLLLFAHMPKYLQFAQINKKFQSDVNKKLIVQKSELIVSREKNNSRIEPKQLRKL